MRIDVILPVFNGARFVRRAALSVLDQDAEFALTVRCIDDHSIDESRAMLGQLASEDPRVVVSANPENRGVSATRNQAIRAGESELIAFIDQDDVWTPGKLAAQYAVLRDRPEVGYVVGRQQMVVEEGSRRPSWCRQEWLEGPQHGFLPGALLVRRTTSLMVGPFDESLKAGGDDTDWFARARRLQIPFVELDDVVLIRHVHESNLSSTRTTDQELLSAVRRHVQAKKDESS